MLHVPATMTLPLKTDDDGVIRVSGTRVTLHTLISAYRQGERPEAIHDAFPTVPLADIYAIISYYLAQRDQIDAYMRKVDEEGKRWQHIWEAQHPAPGKAELLARMIDG
jgi:uncharacterized protein (DUF433 family)